MEFLYRVIVPAKGEVNDMDKWLIKVNDNVVPRRTLIPLNVADICSPVKIKRIDTFDALVEKRWVTAMNTPKTTELNSK